MGADRTGHARCDQFAATRDPDLVTGHPAVEPLSRRLACFGGFAELDALLDRGGENGTRQRVFRVALQAGHEREHFGGLEAGGHDLFGQRRGAVGERAGLVEDRGPVSDDLLEYDRVPDDDGAPGAEGNRADDGDWYRDEHGTAWQLPALPGTIASPLAAHASASASATGV